MKTDFFNSKAVQSGLFEAFGLPSVSGDLRLIKAQLDEMSAKVERALERTEEDKSQPSFSESASKLLRSSLRGERVRRSLLEDSDGQFDPSWTILIRLFLARIDGEQLTASDLDMADEGGRFWLRTLVTRGLIQPVYSSGDSCDISYCVTETAYSLLLANGFADPLDSPRECPA